MKIMYFLGQFFFSPILLLHSPMEFYRILEKLYLLYIYDFTRLINNI